MQTIMRNQIFIVFSKVLLYYFKTLNRARFVNNTF